MTLAMMYPVDTHEISSSVAPRFPIMCGMATLTIDVSISSSTAASVTAMAMRYLYLYLSSTAGRTAPTRAPVARDSVVVAIERGLLAAGYWLLVMVIGYWLL